MDKENFLQILKLAKIDTNKFYVGNSLQLRTEFFSINLDGVDKVFVKYGGGLLEIEEFFARVAVKEY